MPFGATHKIGNTYYKLGNFYAMYYSNGIWKESASITNKNLGIIYDRSRTIYRVISVINNN